MVVIYQITSFHMYMVMFYSLLQVFFTVSLGVVAEFTLVQWHKVIWCSSNLVQ